MQFRTMTMLLVTVAVVSACAPNTFGGPTTEDNVRTRNGAIIGAATGALIGGTRNGDDKLAKAAIGAVIGGAIGAGIGSALDRQAAELRGSIGDNRVSVTNTGNELIVNLPQDILFATDSATLRGDLTADLRAVARNLQSYPDSTVQVIGHTDNVGAAAYNQDLSQRRANSVAAILRDSGVPGGRIAAFGRGEDQPVASNLSDAGRAQNRRVEIIIRPN